MDKNAVALFEPRLIKDFCLVCKYEILLGDEYDGVLARFGRVGRGGVKVLIAFNAPIAARIIPRGLHHPMLNGSVNILG